MWMLATFHCLKSEAFDRCVHWCSLIWWGHTRSVFLTHTGWQLLESQSVKPLHHPRDLSPLSLSLHLPFHSPHLSPSLSPSLSLSLSLFYGWLSLSPSCLDLSPSLSSLSLFLSLPPISFSLPATSPSLFSPLYPSLSLCPTHSPRAT